MNISFCAPEGGDFVISPKRSRCFLTVAIVMSQRTTDLESHLRALVSAIQAGTHRRYEIIVAVYTTQERLSRDVVLIAQRYPSLKIMVCKPALSYAGAIVRAWQVSSGGYLCAIRIGDDGAIRAFPSVLRALTTRSEFKLIIGSRFLKPTTHHTQRSPVSRIHRLQRIVGHLLYPELFLKCSDPMSDFFMVARSAVIEIPLHPRGTLTLAELLFRTMPDHIGEIAYSPSGAPHPVRTLVVELMHLFRLQCIRVLHTAFKILHTLV